MLHRSARLSGSHVVASDGGIGKIHDVYFDDQHWIVRHLVVDTGGWLNNRKVLISPYSVRATDTEMRIVSVDLDRARIEQSPHFATDRPVSRQYESKLYQYYLRSTVEVTGYRIRATDEPVGHVQDFLIQDETWRIHHLVISTRNWLPGKHVLVSPGQIRDVDWMGRTVTVDLSSEEIKRSRELGTQSLDAPIA